jgi:hypothetical protein
MNILYWISVVIAIIAFGGISKSGNRNTLFDRLWIPLYIIAFIVALLNSKSFIVGISTAIVLLFGNGLFWGIVWRRKSKKLQELLKNKK